VYCYNWYRHWCNSQIDVSVYLADVIRKAIRKRVFCSCGGVELGLTTGPLTLNQQSSDYQAQKQQQSCCDAQDQVKVELLLVFCNASSCSIAILSLMLNTCYKTLPVFFITIFWLQKLLTDIDKI
jgi:hypothetical protein